MKTKAFFNHLLPGERIFHFDLRSSSVATRQTENEFSFALAAPSVPFSILHLNRVWGRLLLLLLFILTTSMTASAAESYGPLLTAKWDQQEPFWNQCQFTDNGTTYQCKTGPNATTAAMILYYWKFPTAQVDAIPSYTADLYYNSYSWKQFNYPALQATTFDWENMIDDYSGDYTSAQADAVAKLMRYVGQAQKTEYGTDGSGLALTDVQNIIDMFTLFGYDPGLCRLVEKSNYSESDWTSLIQGELAAGRPVMYIAMGTYDGYNVVQIFNVDGYNATSDQYHVNFGFGGDGDGWFPINSITLSGITYNQNHQAIVGIQPLFEQHEPYASLSTDGKTLTFYYDKLRSTRPGTTYDLNVGYNEPGWCADGSNTSVTRVEFDPSFADARPTTTYKWFSNMNQLTTSPDFTYLNTSAVKNMAYMFEDCQGLTSLDLSHFDTQKVTDMSYMFLICTSLTSLDLSGFNTSNVEFMHQMFSYCMSMKSLDLSSFNTENVTSMMWMFYGSTKLKTIYVSSGWNTDKVTDSADMFKDCDSLVGGKGTTFDENHVDKAYAHIDGGTDNPGYFTEAPKPYAVYDSSNSTLTFYHDSQRASHNGEGVLVYDLNTDKQNPGWLGNYGNRNITTVVFDPSFADARPTTTYKWFYSVFFLNNITGLEYLNTSEVTDMSYMFGSNDLVNLDLSTFDTQKVTDMSYMFGDINVMESVNVSSFDTRNVMYMEGMFYECSALTALDLSNFNTQNVKSFKDMFFDCASLTSLDLSNFDTQNAETMNAMFIDCSNLANLNVSGFNTGHVGDMSSMFSGCSSLTALDLSSFDTSDLLLTNYMFSGCSNLTTIYVGDSWDEGNIEDSDGMFTGCTSIVGGMDTTYDENHVDAAYAHIDGGLDNPGYLSKYDIGLKVGGVNVNVTNMDDVLGDGTVIYNPATITLTLNNANIVVESGHAIETTADYSGTQLIIELLGQNYINSGDEDIVLTTNTFIKGPGELTLEDNSSGIIQMNGTHNLFITYGCTIRARIIRAPGFYTGSDTGDLFVTGADTRIILRAGDETEANIYGFNDVILDEDSGLEFTYPAGAWYDKEDEYCVMCDEGEAYGVIIECPSYYVVYDSNTTTLTFYNDGQRASHNSESEKVYFLNQGSTVPTWYSDNSSASVTKVVFHESFADVRPTSTYGWFTQMKNLTSITGIENLNTSEVTTMRSMFNNCSKLTSINLSHFNTAKVTSMRQMFLNCENLTSLDLSNFNTAKVTDMYNMFGGCSGLTSIDLSNFNTAKVTDMGYMFSWCTSLTSLDLRGLDTKNVTNMGFMFYKSSNLTSIDLSSFNTAKVTAMDRMFSGCTSLTTVYAGENWSTAAVNESDYMFTNCTNIKGGMGTTHDPYHVDAEYAHVDGGASNPGYFTYKPAALLGDVNGDGKVDVADITALTNHLLGTGGSFNEQAADVNLSGSVTTADTKIIVEYLLGKINLESFTVEVKALHARMETAEEYYKMSKAELESKDSGHAQNALWEMASEIEAMIIALQEQLESVSSEYDVEVCQASENELLERIEILNVAINELQ